jgi:hypothetical protein
MTAGHRTLHRVVYSPTLFQNLLGSDIRNADRIVPELQDLEVGDTVWLASQDRLGPRAPHGRGSTSRMSSGRRRSSRGRSRFQLHALPASG